MNILITGISGFVGYYLVKELRDQFPLSKIWGIDMAKPDEKFEGFKDLYFSTLNLADADEVKQELDKIKPAWIFHLAAFSSVAKSWQDPVGCFQNNTNIFLNLIEAVRVLGLKTRILSVGSSEEYGQVSEKDTPIKEEKALDPANPYAVARVSQELLSQVYHQGYGIEIILTRSFNHMGPGQRPIFFIPSMAEQIVKTRKQGLKTGKIRAGNLEIIRDFLDVRDVVRAYVELMKSGVPGQIYNVCSGNGNSLKIILEKMIEFSGVSMEIERDETLVRPTDNPIIIGSLEKIKQTTGWFPRITLDESLKAVLKDFENR